MLLKKHLFDNESDVRGAAETLIALEGIQIGI